MLSFWMDAVESAARRAKAASYRLQSMPREQRDRALAKAAEFLRGRANDIFAANGRDLKRAEEINLASPLLKRLAYDQQKLEESAQQLRSLMEQADPVGKLLARTELDRGLILDKVSCPIGVIAVIFESRPDALVQICGLALKSGNAVILKGGSEAKETNEALSATIVAAVESVDAGFKDAVQLLSTREEVRALLALDSYIDLVIPRGSNELVRSIQASTRIPVLGHSAGVCHTYIDRAADLEMAVRIAYDAKCQYPAVCNAMESLLVHREVAQDFLPKMAARYAGAKVELRGDDETRRYIEASPATDGDWGTEYNDLILAVKVVGSLQEAVDHINRFGSHHTDAIVTADEEDAKRFMGTVDSASVMWNCSTRFADGYRYGLGAEVGISTNKTHARGPVGLEGLVIYKYKLYGQGQIVAEYAGPNAKQFTHRKIA
jgi:glutamate-5-semialdehyde dehydrogenase